MDHKAKFNKATGAVLNLLSVDIFHMCAHVWFYKKFYANRTIFRKVIMPRHRFLADRVISFVQSVTVLSSVTLCIVAKRCVLAQWLLLRA